MVVLFSADILLKIVISLYFASSLSLAHFLHSWYVKEDPIYKGEMGIGPSFFHKDSTRYTYGYIMTPILFALIFIVTLSTLSIMPELKTLTFDSFLWNYGLWIFLEMVVIYFICDAVSPSGSKLIQNALAIFIGFMILRSSTADATLDIVLANWQNNWPIYAAPIGWGMYWVTAFQRDRMRRAASVAKDKSEQQVMGVYRVPVIYYFVVIFWNIFFGFGFSLLSFFLSHFY